MTARATAETETKAASPVLKADATGEFEIRFATKRDAGGELVVDHDGDVYADGAIGEQQVLVGCWNHGDACPGPAGTATTFETSADIRAKGRLLVETEHGRDEFARWRALGAMAEFSYQFRVLDHDYIPVNGRTVRRLKRLEVISVDLVARGAGIGTGIVSLKSGSACGCPVKAELLQLKAESLRILSGEPGDAGEAAVRKVLMAEKARFEELMAEYPEVADATVPPSTRDAAAKGAAAAARQLGIDPPEIRWFRKGLTGSPTRLGFTCSLAPQHVAHLRGDLAPETAYEVAAHEVAHLAGADEDQALTFGEWMLEEALASWRGIH